MIDRHLTDEEFGELLAGSAAAEPQAHVQACTRCRAEFETFRRSVGDFHELGMLWAEAEAPRRIRLPIDRWQRWPLRSLSLVSVTAIVACFVLFGIRTTRIAAGPAHEVVSSALSAPPQAKLAEDNQLMMSIDRELSADVDLSVPVQELRSAAAVRRPRAAANMEN
jgi:anti-sigma factor RsiW